jgi:hypothetical protein
MFKYDVSDAFIERSIDTLGVKQPKRWSIAFDLTDDSLNAAVRRRLRQAYEVYHAVPEFPLLPEPVDDVEAFLTQLEPWIVERADAVAPGGGANDPAEFDRRKEEWIAAHGSPRLRLGHERGYKVNKLYAQERARAEFPGAWVDTSGTAEFNERTDPSSDALELETEVDKRIERLKLPLSSVIVWLTEPPRDLADALDERVEPFEPQEALAIFEYLGRYDVYLPVDPEDRAPVEVD